MVSPVMSGSTPSSPYALARTSTQLYQGQCLGGRLLCSIEHSVSEDGAFLNCVFLSYNIPSAPHKDSNQSIVMYANMLIPLSGLAGR